MLPIQGHLRMVGWRIPAKSSHLVTFRPGAPSGTPAIGPHAAVVLISTGMATKDRDRNVENLLERLGVLRENSSESFGQMLGIFVVGGLVGATLALFFGPKGSEPRKEMGQRVDEALAEYDTAKAVGTTGPKVPASSAAAR